MKKYLPRIIKSAKNSWKFFENVRSAWNQRNFIIILRKLVGININLIEKYEMRKNDCIKILKS